jgi:hypothetical protein
MTEIAALCFNKIITLLLTVSGQVGDTLAHRAERNGCVKICFLILPTVCFIEALELMYRTTVLRENLRWYRYRTAPNYMYFIFLIVCR